MGIETARSGTIPLKEGVTLEQVVRLWITDEDDEIYPKITDGNLWSDDYTTFTLDDRDLYYEFNGDSSWYSEQSDSFLKAAATELAGAGWWDRDRSWDGDGEETAFAPNKREELVLKRNAAHIALAEAQRQLTQYQTELDVLDGQANPAAD